MKKLLLLALLPACVTTESAFKKDAATQVAYALDCTPDQLQMTVFKRVDGVGCAGSEVGVSGCGRRTTYRCLDNQTWEKTSDIVAEAVPSAGVGVEAVSSSEQK